MVRSRGWPVVPVAVILLVCTLLVPAVAAGAAAERADTQTGESSLATQEFEADRTEFRVTVYANGSAKWVFRHTQNLENEQEREDFESFAEEFNNNETELYTNFQNRAQALADNGSESTGREMSAENFQRSARTGGSINENQGIVEMSFRWEGFAQTSDGRVVVGDIFQGGLYLSEDQRFYVFRGPGLAFQDISPEEDATFSDDRPADSSYVAWEGERSFIDNRPRIVLVDEENVVTETNDDDGGPAGAGPGWILPMGALFVVILLGLGAAVAYRSGVFPPDDDGVATDVDDGGGSPGDASVAAAGAGAADGDAGAGAGAGAAAAGVPEEELISDEERVVNLLEDSGGRMKQVNIVDETGWSKSKVSMLLSDMEEEGTISKLRVGRENIVSLSGEEPDAAGSPFDDED